MPWGNNTDIQEFSGAFRVFTGAAGALNDLLFDQIDTVYFRWWSLSIVGNNHVGRLSWLCSDDNFASAPVNMYAYQEGVPSAYYQNATNVGNATQIFHGPFHTNWFRVIMDQYTSGSVTATLVLYSHPSFPGTINAIQTGRWALGASVNSNQNGTTCFRLISANTNNASVIKNSTGQVYGYDIYNSNAAVRYVKLYNKSSTPNPATDNALLVRTIAVEAGKKAVYHSSEGLNDFPNGIAMATVTGISDTDNTPVGSNDLAINIDYSLN